MKTTHVPQYVPVPPPSARQKDIDHRAWIAAGMYEHQERLIVDHLEAKQSRTFFAARKQFPGLRHRKEGEEMKNVALVPKQDMSRSPKTAQQLGRHDDRNDQDRLVKELFDPMPLDEIYRNKLENPNNTHMLPVWVPLSARRHGRPVFQNPNRFLARETLRDSAPYIETDYDASRKASYIYEQKNKEKEKGGPFYATTPRDAKESIAVDYFMYSGSEGDRKTEIADARFRGSLGDAHIFRGTRDLKARTQLIPSPRVRAQRRRPNTGPNNEDDE